MVHPRTLDVSNREIPPLDPFDPFPEPSASSSEAFAVETACDVLEWIASGTYRALFHGSERAVSGEDPRLLTSTTSGLEIVAAA